MISFWTFLWSACLVAAAISFTLITLVIAIRGVGELREMIRTLSAAEDTPKTKRADSNDSAAGHSDPPA